MALSTESAQQIVSEISVIVKQNVNMMNVEGYIIASTDSKRIGNFHEGAKKIIDEHLEEFYVTPEMETLTTRTGLNLPITFEGETIGVIGITGAYEQVYNYGQIVKKMTEILVRENYIRAQEQFDKKMERHFLEDWILGTGVKRNKAFFERGLGLHIDITIPRRVMVLRLENFHHLSGTGEGQKIIEKVELAVSALIREDSRNVYLNLTTKQICLVTPRSDEQMKILAQQLIQRIRTEFDICLLVGIDNGEEGSTDMGTAYAKANKASHACLTPMHPIMLYDQINMEIFMDDIPKGLKTEYLRKIFSGCNVAADKLFMHKNTLQYKLRRLEECTGYDVRLPSHGPIFYMAILFFHDVERDLMVWSK